MIQFVNKEFITENLPGDGILVIDTDLQGAWETGVHARLRYAFPKIYKTYQATCFYDYKREGSCMLLEEAGYNIALLFTRRRRSDSKKVMMTNLESALVDLCRKVPCDIYMYSSILSKKDKCFNDIRVMLRKHLGPLNYNWFIYRKECPVITKEIDSVTN